MYLNYAGRLHGLADSIVSDIYVKDLEGPFMLDGYNAMVIYQTDWQTERPTQTMEQYMVYWFRKSSRRLCHIGLGYLEYFNSYFEVHR